MAIDTLTTLCRHFFATAIFTSNAGPARLVADAGPARLVADAGPEGGAGGTPGPLTFLQASSLFDLRLRMVPRPAGRPAKGAYDGQRGARRALLVGMPPLTLSFHRSSRAPDRRECGQLASTGGEERLSCESSKSHAPAGNSIFIVRGSIREAKKPECA